MIHSGGSRGGEVGFLPPFVDVPIFPHDISETDAARITNLDMKMFHDESWKSIYFGFKKSKVKVTSHNNIASVGLCTLVSAGFFWLIYCAVRQC